MSTRSSPSDSGTSSESERRPDVLSFTTAGGQLWAYCANGTPHARSIVPAEGWRFRFEREGALLEVTFEPSAVNTTQIEVHISCVAGSPVFAIDA